MSTRSDNVDNDYVLNEGMRNKDIILKLASSFAHWKGLETVIKLLRPRNSDQVINNKHTCHASCSL